MSGGIKDQIANALAVIDVAPTDSNVALFAAELEAQGWTLSRLTAMSDDVLRGVMRDRLADVLGLLSEDDLHYEHGVSMGGEPLDPELFVHWDHFLSALARSSRDYEPPTAAEPKPHGGHWRWDWARVSDDASEPVPATPPSEASRERDDRREEPRAMTTRNHGRAAYR